MNHEPIQFVEVYIGKNLAGQVANRDTAGKAMVFSMVITPSLEVVVEFP